MGDVSDLTTYKEAIVSPRSNFWINPMKDEMCKTLVNLIFFEKGQNGKLSLRYGLQT